MPIDIKLGTTCGSAAMWLVSLEPNWDALSAVGTIGATLVALFLPLTMARLEWARQDARRFAEAAAISRAESDLNRELCSAVDQCVAYWEVAIAIFKSEPVYNVGILAVKRISLNAGILLETLELLEGRIGISDGAIYSSIASKRIAAKVMDETGRVLSNWGTLDPEWNSRIAGLESLSDLVAMTKIRSAGVRSWFKLSESTSAATIRTTYFELAANITAARLADSGEPNFSFEHSHL